MTNPYTSRPDYAFWKRSVSGRGAQDVDPVVEAKFHIGPDDKIATAGSCFAQHISRMLVREGYRYLVTEEAPPDDPNPENYGVFPARFGNIYTVRQLLQTFNRAYGLFHPSGDIWWKNGRAIDAFRPQIVSDGFADKATLRADRVRHLACVRRMFERCDAFVFTLGLTEAWTSLGDGAVYPVAPGVSGGHYQPEAHEFRNFGVEEMVADLREFMTKLRVVNPRVRVMLTVSPVPLIATYEDRHVLVSTVASKSALRVVADMVSRDDPAVAYFPSYEIITGPQSGGRFFEEDLRNVRDDGVAYVMSLFAKHYMRQDAKATEVERAVPASLTTSDQRRFAAAADIVCDEEAIDP